jgi:hypothetical protein
MVRIWNFFLENIERYRKIGDGDILVYTMGKVGSSSIFNNLNRAYQTHNLDMESPSKYFASRYSRSILRQSAEMARWKLLHWAFSRRTVDCNKRKIITIVRDPIARNVSAYFETLSLSQLPEREYLEDDFFVFTNHFVPLLWFDIEFKRNLHVDVYKHPFNKSEGYTIIDDSNVSILIIQLEKLNGLEQVIKEFIGDPTFCLDSKSSANISHDKWYADPYKEMKEGLQLPKQYVELMYSSKYTHHFYSAEQISAFENRWIEHGTRQI